MARLDGKTAVVVGCATGIGARTARMIAAAGARVVLGDVLAEGAERAASDIRAAGGSAVATRVDISSDDDVASLFELAEKTYGGADVLANIAADTRIYVEDARTDAAQVSMAVWDRTLDVNLKGFVRTIRHAIPQMLRKGSGAIVNISSIGSLQPDTWAGAYSASKAAVNALTMHIASAYGRRGIRCNAIAPGAIRTPENQQATESAAIWRAFAKYTPTPRLGLPEDIAHALIFLASDEAEFVNGQILQVDGGVFAHTPWSADAAFGAVDQLITNFTDIRK